MASEITGTDQIVLHKTGAWHHMGIVLDEALSPRAAVQKALPYTVGQSPVLMRGLDGEVVQVDGHVVNYRLDNGDPLGVVSDNYRVIQPLDMANFAEALVDDGSTKIKVETCGSIRGGRRLWILLKGEEFGVKNNDSVFPYVLLSNGYDGTSAFRVTPTTVRVVCSNTLHAVIPRTENGTLGTSAISIRHTVNAMDRVDEARKALASYNRAIEATKETFNILSSKDVTSDDVKKFFLEAYAADFGEIPANPKTVREETKRDKALSALSSFSKRFDDERTIAGSTWWNAANAYSGLIQHDLKARGKDDVKRIESRVDSNLFGLNQERSFAAFGRAFRMATVGV